jgi:hypothetical protein
VRDYGRGSLAPRVFREGSIFLLSKVGLAYAVPRTSRIVDDSVLAIDQEMFVTLEQQE